MKKVLILGDAGSAHLSKWILALHGKYLDIAVFSLSTPAKELQELSHLKVHVYAIPRKKFSSSLLNKFAYLSALPQLRGFAMEFKPDMVHAHYASSYGLLGSMLGIHPLIISAWGSDVYDFGNSLIGRLILRSNFRNAQMILSTSEVMKQHMKRFTSKEIIVTPFGVDTEVFLPGKMNATFFPHGSFVFGMVKSMERIYAVDLVIQAFAQLRDATHDKSIRLLLVGGGTKLEEYRMLCRDLNISDLVHFTDRIDHKDVPHHHQMIDVFLNPSHTESFGVAVLEAMSCSKPVIVSDVGGLAEIVENNSNGLKVKVNDVHDLFSKMKLLHSDSLLRNQLALAARRFVEQKYSWNSSVKIMLNEVYKMEKI